MFRTAKVVSIILFLITPSIVVAQSVGALSSALDANEFTFESAAPAWVAQSDEVFPGLAGNQSAAVAAAISDGQGSSMSTNVTAMDGAVLMFHWQVSSEINDRLQFTATDIATGAVVSQLTIAGVTDWAEQTVGLSAGNYEFKWAYLKDDATSFAEDTGWVDNLRFENIQPADNSSNDEFCTVLKASNGNIAVICL